MSLLKKINMMIAAALVLVLTLGILTACAKSSPSGSSSTADSASEEETFQNESSPAEKMIPATDAGTKTLVVYFSATGNTKSVAGKIIEATGSDGYEIIPAQPYTEDDLNYNDPDSRSSKEQNDDGARPEIGGEKLSLDDYAIIYIGYPIWWGKAPRIMETFVESYNFEGKTVFPFCTSGSSPIGDSAKNLAKLSGGTWLDGKRFSSDPSDEEIEMFINGTNL